MKTDPDLDLLRLEAETATTPTRRAWATRLLERILKLEDGIAGLTASTTWTTKIPPDGDPPHRDPSYPEAVPDDGGGAGSLPAS